MSGTALASIMTFTLQAYFKLAFLPSAAIKFTALPPAMGTIKRLPFL